MNLTPRVAVIVDQSAEVAALPPVAAAVEELRDALHARGVAVDVVPRVEDALPASRMILIAGAAAPWARQLLQRAGVTLAPVAEALAFASDQIDGCPVILAAGHDARGLAYATLDLADRVANATDPLAALDQVRPGAEQPANPIRGVTRLYVSDVEDRSWFHDRSFWRRYLAMLVTQRFNRFNLSFGMGHDFLRNVIDADLLFAYPFFVDVPGYAVRAVGLPDEERARNLASLRFIGEEAKRRGLHFQLGLWTHGYAWVDSPSPNYTIDGLNAENHAAYCRDALRTLLIACPSIDGVTLRVHGESGVPEGNYDFWRTVFRGAVECGRPVELDLHPKGMDREMLAVALETGLPVRLSPKYTAEHLGLPYQQASIRNLERDTLPPEGDPFVAHLMNQSAGRQRFTRYGYADFLRADRPYGVFFRVWPGTQRFLLWGDPELAAGFGRHGHFCGSEGVELCEPLSFKGRRGSGLPGGRDGYRDVTLRPPGGDWEKYLYTYRLFGRLLYNPDADPETWRRFLVEAFGDAAEPIEKALAAASRVLPLITTAHHPSAANNRFWPEIYTNMPIVDPERPHPYGDTPSPKRFGTVSALDPVLFSSVDDFVDEALQGRLSGRYTPLWVASHLDALADAAAGHLAEATARLGDPSSPEFRRVAVDIGVQAGLGRFFARKLRAAVAYALGVRANSAQRLQEALGFYQDARAAWVEVVTLTTGVYREDLTVGGEPWLRGHWADRLGAIDVDLQDLAAAGQRLRDAAPELTAPPAEPAFAEWVREVEALPPVTIAHHPPDTYQAGVPLPINLSIQWTEGSGRMVEATLLYRHVNQSEDYARLPMEPAGHCFRADIPGRDTDSRYPLQYFFEIRAAGGAKIRAEGGAEIHAAGGAAWLYPGFGGSLANQPYFVVDRSQAEKSGVK